MRSLGEWVPAPGAAPPRNPDGRGRSNTGCDDEPACLAVTSAADPYRPGACNIGQAEIARRRRVGILGVAAAVVLAAGLLVAGAPSPRAAGGAAPRRRFAGLLQARFRFCAAYGAAGLRNFGFLGRAERVDDPAARRADRARSAAIIAAAGVTGLAGALGLFRLPA